MHKWLSIYQNLAGRGVVQKSAYAMYKILQRFLLNKNVVDTNGSRLTPRRPYLPSANGKNTGRSIVCVTGFGHSGSGAVVDLLSEYKGVDVIGLADKNGSLRDDSGFEFDFLRATGGLFNIEAQYHDKGWFPMGDAIRMFLRLIAYMHLEVGGRFNNEFLNATRDFLDKLLLPMSNNVSADGGACGYAGRGHLSVLGVEGARLVWGDNGVERAFHLRKLSVSEYRGIAREYISRVLDILTSERIVVLDQAVTDWTADIGRYRDYLGPLKLIAVYRDPRDSFVTGRHFKECWLPCNPKDYAMMVRNWMEPYMRLMDSDFLIIRFEDLVGNYTEVVSRIERFLGLTSEAHVRAKQAFDPNVSAKNIGIYKTYEDQKSVSVVAQMMPEFIYQSFDGRSGEG